MIRRLAILAALVVCATAARAQAPNRVILPNASSTGTTLWTLTKITGAPSTAVIVATGDSSGIVGITIAGAGTSGDAVVQISGQAPCVFDGATTANDYVTKSSTVAGVCEDTGSTTYPSGLVVGRVLSTNGAAGTYPIEFPPDISAGGSPVSSVFGRTGTVVAASNDYTCAQVTSAACQGGVQNQTYTYAAGGGTANAQTLTLAPALTAYAAGQYFCWLPNAANTTATPTLNINGLGAKTIVKANGVALAANDLITTAVACGLYDGTNVELQNPAHVARTCIGGLGDGYNVIPAETYLQFNCVNSTGRTLTIAGISCWTDNAGSSTLDADNNAATDLLTGAITCDDTKASGGQAGTQSATTTLASGDAISFTFVADGSSKQTTWTVTLTQ